MKVVTVPTSSGIGHAAKSYGIGMAAGIVYALLSGLFGSGFLGSIATGVLTGAMVKSDIGTAITAQSGFTGGISGYAQFMGALSGPSNGGSSIGVM
ncbi:MAG: hypothetical protein JW901_05560 [Dehalococcoidia bacterium]|nr:hypothetical protein [Dehalococcoidia bacterium]